MKPLIKSGDNWTFSLLEQLDDLGAKYMEELGFTYYPLQVEIVSPEQMLGLYTSSAMPINYNHWSFGEEFISERREFFAGRKGLAYEICKNTNPCLCYNMESNNAIEQASVIWHVYGHSSHFASNYLHKNNSDADNLVPYMEYARTFIRNCEYKYGESLVEHVLDLAHSLQYNSMNHYNRYPVDYNQKMLERELNLTTGRDYLIDKLSNRKDPQPEYWDEDNHVGEDINLPEENLLYFIEKNSPILNNWQRELLHIVRNLAQFSYQNISGQSQIMAEGTAMFTECYIMERAHQDGYIDQGSYLEYLKMNSGVLRQVLINSRIDDPFSAMQHGKLNPYFIGLEMMRDIKRMCQDPNESDRKFYRDICGSDWKKTLSDAISYYKDDSFIRQFLSPTLIKKLRLMHSSYDSKAPNEIKIESHAQYVDDIREALANINTMENYIPNVKITDYDGDVLDITYFSVYERKLYEAYAVMTKENISELMGCRVKLWNS